MFFTDQPNIVINSGTRPSIDMYCHHQITYCTTNIEIPPPPPFERKIWHYNRADVNLLKKSINNFPWENYLSQNRDPNWQVKSFTEIFLNIMSNFIPNEITKVKPRDPPWITKELKTILNRKNRLYNNYKRHGYQIIDKVRLEKFRKQCQELIELHKSRYIQKLGKRLADPTTSQKCYWKAFNKVINKCKAPKIPPLLVNNKFIIDCKEKANLFTKYFSEQCKIITNISVLPIFTYITDHRINTIPINDEEIINLIRKLNPNKSNGSDGISSRMLLLCDDSIVLPLRIIFNSIIETSIYPNMWKLANVTPIHKKENKQIIKNYRPISLLPICSKLFEKIIFKHLYNYLSTNNLITKNQSGFRPGDSTVNQLIDFVNEIHKSFDNKNSLELRAVFLDISKAFDKVWHEGLIFKIKQNGVSGKLLALLSNYLMNRYQRVVLNGSVAEYSMINSGVPQGSVLGPLLFLIYINDLEINIKSQVKFFADDTMLFSIVKDPVVSALELNNDLLTVSNWAFQWKMEFNPDPNKQATELLFSQKKIKPIHPPLYFNDVEVTKVTEHKHLGLILDEKLCFEKHINEKIKIALKGLTLIKKLYPYLPIKTLDQMYKILIRPHFDYCDIIYHLPSLINLNYNSNTLNYLMESIEKIQYQAALAVTGAWKGSNRNRLYEELGWETLSDRRWHHRLIQIYKIINKISPQYLNNNLPNNRLPLYRQANSYHNIHCRTTKYMNSFFPHSVQIWNQIGRDFQNCTSVIQFKKYSLPLIRPKKKNIFNIFDPIGLKYIFQLRVGLSPLNYHKNRYKFKDTPSADCKCSQSIENTDHFLFHCLLYIEQRRILFLKTFEILQKYQLTDLKNNIEIYLYGHNNVSISENQLIIRSTIQYIRDTQRFLHE